MFTVLQVLSHLVNMVANVVHGVFEFILGYAKAFSPSHALRNPASR
jgi:hypothetical protein